MKKTLIAAVAALSTAITFAEEDDTTSSDIPVVATNAVSSVKTFAMLPLCQRIEGVAYVRKPRGNWVLAEEGRFYPFGTSYRVEDGNTLVVSFGANASATISNGAEFGTREQAVGLQTRSIVLVRGTVNLRLPATLPEGAFTVAAPGFTVKNPAGDSSIQYSDLGDGDEAIIRCVTGTLGISGRHFDIPQMRAADEIKIRTSKDHLSTILFGTSGDYFVDVSQGSRYKEEINEDGLKKVSVEEAFLKWSLSPLTKIVINRSVPAIGERMSVHTMAFDAAGERKSECSFCEGRAEVNSGELVPKEVVSSEEIAKRASEVTEEAATETTEEAVEEESTSEEEE